MLTRNDGQNIMIFILRMPKNMWILWIRSRRFSSTPDEVLRTGVHTFFPKCGRHSGRNYKCCWIDDNIGISISLLICNYDITNSILYTLDQVQHDFIVAVSKWRLSRTTSVSFCLAECSDYFASAMPPFKNYSTVETLCARVWDFC